MDLDRRPAVDTAYTPESSAPRWLGWKFAAGTAAITFGVCVFMTFWLPGLFGDRQWLTLGDLHWTIQSTQYVANGGIGYVYSVNDQYLPLPGFLLLFAPFVGLGDHFGLVNGYPIPIRHPSMLIVAGPAAFAYGVTCILGVDYLASVLRVARRRRRVLAVAIALFLVIPTLCWAGHPEDLVALTLSSVSLALLIRGRYQPAAAVLAVAIIMQPWTLLFIPLVAVCSPAPLRVRSVLYSSALPSLMGLLLVSLDPHDAVRSLIQQPMQGDGQHLPWWVFSHPMVVVMNGMTDPVRVGSGPRILAVLTAVAGAWWIRNRITPQNIVLVASVVLVARGIFETQVWSYYLGPAAVFLGLGAALTKSPTRALAGGSLALAFYCSVGASYNAWSAPPFLALIVLVGLALAALRAARLYLTSPAMADSTPFTNFPDSSVE